MLRRGLQTQGIMRSVMEYDCKYMNATGYWLHLGRQKSNCARNVWLQTISGKRSILMYAILYHRGIVYVFGTTLGVLKMASNYYVYANMVLPVLE